MSKLKKNQSPAELKGCFVGLEAGLIFLIWRGQSLNAELLKSADALSGPASTPPKEIGLTVEEIDADNFEGALLRISGTPRGTVVLNKNIREDGRKLFTLAHEIGHYILPDQQEQAGSCSRNEIAQWSSQLPLLELQANRFAAEILMPEQRLVGTLRKEPRFDLATEIAEQCQTTLTAALYRYVELSTFRIAMVWSTKCRSTWYKASQEFGRAIELGELSADTYAYDCFQGRSVPSQLEPVPREGLAVRFKSTGGGEDFGTIGILAVLHEHPLAALLARTRGTSS